MNLNRTTSENWFTGTAPFAVTGALIGYFLVHQFSLPAETALRLTEASLLAEGGKMYIDFLDNATPYYLYFNLLPVLISRLTFIHPIAICNIWTAVIFLWCSCSIVTVGRLGGAASKRNPMLISSGAVLAGFILTTVLQLLYFGQANQLFFMALCPYIIVRACTVRGMAGHLGRMPLALGLTLALVALIDPLYGLFVLLFELLVLVGMYPYPRLSFLLKRLRGIETIAFFSAYLLIAVLVALLPSSNIGVYLGPILQLNHLAFLDSLDALNFSNCASDSRPSIYFAVFCLVSALPAVRRNILSRYFATASMLGLGLMVLQGATLYYQSYLFMAPAAMALASALPDYLRRFRPFKRAEAAVTGATTAGKNKFSPVPIVCMAVSALAFYFCGLCTIPRGHSFALSDLGYYGTADRRDLAVFSEPVEEFSKVREPIAILGLGVRPAYPVTTQLRRRPGLSLCWGFPFDSLEKMEQPMYADQMAALRDFKTKMYADLGAQLSSRERAPVFLMIDGDTVRRLMEEHGVFKSVEDNYAVCGGAAIEDASNKDNHPPAENIGYKSGFTIFRHR